MINQSCARRRWLTSNKSSRKYHPSPSFSCSFTLPVSSLSHALLTGYAEAAACRVEREVQNHNPFPLPPLNQPSRLNSKPLCPLFQHHQPPRGALPRPLHEARAERGHQHPRGDRLQGGGGAQEGPSVSAKSKSCGVCALGAACQLTRARVRVSGLALIFPAQVRAVERQVAHRPSEGHWH